MQTHDLSSANGAPAERILRPREVAERLGVSLPTIFRMRRRGELPRRFVFRLGLWDGWHPRSRTGWRSGRPTDDRSSGPRDRSLADTGTGTGAGAGTVPAVKGKAPRTSTSTSTSTRTRARHRCRYRG